MRFVVASLISLSSSLAFAAIYDVDTVCRTQSQGKQLKALCTEPLLSSTRQLERSYWAVLGDSATPESYQALHSDLLMWKASYAVCGSNSTEQEIAGCLNQAILKFGAALDSRFSESMEDIVDTDELFEAANRALASLHRQMAKNLDTCRMNAESRLDDGTSPARDIALTVSQSCCSLAFDYVDFSIAEEEGTALYILKDSLTPPDNLRKVTEQRYGLNATIPFVVEARAARK